MSTSAEICQGCLACIAQRFPPMLLPSMFAPFKLGGESKICLHFLYTVPLCQIILMFYSMQSRDLCIGWGFPQQSKMVAKNFLRPILIFICSENQKWTVQSYKPHSIDLSRILSPTQRWWSEMCWLFILDTLYMHFTLSGLHKPTKMYH